MLGSSTAEKPGLTTATKLGIFGRVAARQVGRTRLVRATWSGARAAASSLGRAARLLWLQITGVFFLSFAAIGALGIVREYRAYHAGTVGPGRVLIAVAFTALFAWFGISSFMRAGQRR